MGEVMNHHLVFVPNGEDGSTLALCLNCNAVEKFVRVMSPEMIRREFERVTPPCGAGVPTNPAPEKKAEMVNSPSHYTPGEREVYKVLHTWGLWRNAYVWTTMTYLARCGFKHESPLEDLKKAYWYLGLAIWEMEGKDVDAYSQAMKDRKARESGHA